MARGGSPSTEELEPRDPELSVLVRSLLRHLEEEEEDAEEEEEEEKKEEEEVLRHLSSTPLRLALRSAARLPRRAARLPRRSSGTVSPILGRG